MRKDSFQDKLAALGIRGAVSYSLKEKLIGTVFNIIRREKTPLLYRLYAPEVEGPIYCRFKSSDILSFRQIFLKKEYAFFDDTFQPRFIIDCGANAGYSSLYFLSKFPEARVLALEPDQKNYEVMVRNLARFGGRVSALLSGVWSKSGGLKVIRGNYKDGREWAIQVSECGEDEEPDVPGFDLATLLAESGFEKIDVLKIDIEGSEAVLFSKNYESWIDKVECFVIELHDERCRDIFFNAIKQEEYKIFRYRELTVAMRLS